MGLCAQAALSFFLSLSLRPVLSGLHKMPHILQEERTHDTDATEGNTHPVRPSIRQRKRLLCLVDQKVHPILAIVWLDDFGARGENVSRLVKPSLTGECDQFCEGLKVGRHVFGETTANNPGGCRDKFVVEDIVVRRESDGAANVTDSERNGCNCADQLMRTRELSDNRAWDNDRSHT